MVSLALPDPDVGQDCIGFPGVCPCDATVLFEMLNVVAVYSRSTSQLKTAGLRSLRCNPRQMPWTVMLFCDMQHGLVVALCSRSCAQPM